MDLGTFGFILFHNILHRSNLLQAAVFGKAISRLPSTAVAWIDKEGAAQHVEFDAIDHQNYLVLRSYDCGFQRHRWTANSSRLSKRLRNFDHKHKMTSTSKHKPPTNIDSTGLG